MVGRCRGTVATTRPLRLLRLVPGGSAQPYKAEEPLKGRGEGVHNISKQRPSLRAVLDCVWSSGLTSLLALGCSAAVAAASRTSTSFMPSLQQAA